MDYKDYILQNNKTHFWFKAKTKLINILFDITFEDKTANKVILDIGCGIGEETQELKKYGNLILLDNDKTTIDLIKSRNRQAILGDIEKIDLKPKSYDYICCFDLLEHLDNDIAALKNIYAGIKEKGYFLFTVPAYKCLLSAHDMALDHRRRYNKKDLEVKLKNAGFNEIKMYYWNSLLFPFIAIIRCLKKIIYIKLLKKEKFISEAKPMNCFINSLLYVILIFEVCLIKANKSLPYGLTICGYAKK
jgi:SAM-dependent methyltransferase